MTGTQIDRENFFRDQVNQYCRLPNISEHDAYDLWHDAIDLVGCIDNLRRIVSRVGAGQVEAMVRSYSRRLQIDQISANFATEIIRKVARKPLVGKRNPILAKASQTGGSDA